MSLCSHTVRAISRTQARNSSTLLPFLYQTATIQQWKLATRPIQGRKISSRSKPTGDVPFTVDIPFADANGNLPPTRDDPVARKTTITDTERAAFEKLYKKFDAQGQGRKKQDGEHEELDQIADEYYEDDEDRTGNTLDKVFDVVLQGKARQKPSHTAIHERISRPKQRREAAAEAKGEAAPAGDSPREKNVAYKAERERVKKLRLDERDRVDKLLKNAQTDHQLWQVLEREVFDQLRKLDLDGAESKSATPDKKTKASGKGKGQAKGATQADKAQESQPATVDKRILFPNYPHHLLTALVMLRTNFPASPLPLTILPTMKSLGRSSYALGATTLLYRHLLRTAWLQQSSYALIDTLLIDMETNVIEFDTGILEVLDAIIKEYEMARSSRLGREMQLVYGMELWGEGAKKVKAWRNVVADRVGVKDEISARGVRWMERRKGDGAMRTGGTGEKTGRDGMSVEGENEVADREDGGSQAETMADAIPFVDDGEVRFESDRMLNVTNKPQLGAPDAGNERGEAESATKVLL
ncbi:hypothetical protein EK21DRAFT_64555 [Setomelanomma holmii]|uniref:Mtf2-like C-terminal domain-containing protein n=1 Tax=Setomelanomma holmii TaxID=210430 RepID=A0A9P4HB65_9PLEO|nr:hypothetical protein EK21DRAFT_64555 [Setomelanomma holmii]